MPTPSSRSRTGSADSGRTGSPDCPLLLECEEEELSEAQVAHYGKRRAAFNQTMARLEELARAGATITTNPDQSVTFRTTETIGTSLGPVSAGPPLPAQPSPTGQYRFLMDPKTGRIIGSLPGQQPAGPTLPSPGVGRGGGRGRGRGRATSTIRATMRPAAPVRRTPPPSVGPVKSPQLVDLTKPGVEPVGAQPIRKAFPALSVSAKPQRAVPAAQAKRSELDARVKGLLVHTPAKFTEWLIQQGLVRSEQFEAGVKLKLGMYSDGKKFPHSGGYVWIQEGSTNKYTSVYRGSLFETGSSSNPPTVLLKMLYHWACQTNIPNVVQWVKVDNKQIDEFYQVLRAVCVAAVQDEVVGLGGQGRPVEIGVISLGTTTADGQKREVRVEVLGVLDRQNRQLRLRATEPVQGATQAERFGKIFEPLPVWLHADSKIMTDYSVDKETLLRLGFRNVSQCSLSQAGSQRPENTNQQIMEYLKKVVPKMFQNTLSNLSTPVIQQFLDELTFRELFGTMPLAAFDGMLKRITGQTAATAGMEDTMKRWLAEVAANPFADWRYSRAEQARVSRESLGRTAKSPGIKRAASQPIEENVDDLVTKKMKTAKEPLQISNPDEKLMMAEQKSLEISSIPKEAAFAAQSLQDLALYDVQGQCCECDKDMTKAEHYIAYLCCTKCRYSSCCSKAMSVHVKLFHSSPNPKYDLGKPLVLDKPMFCVCGFSANSGNKLAKHLGSHGCNSAYPSLEKAKNVRVESDLYEDETSMDRLDEELEKGLGRRNSITDTSEKEFEIKDATLDSGDSNPIHGKQRKNSKDEEEEGKGENERTYTESDAIRMAKGGKKESGEKEDESMEVEEPVEDPDEEKQPGQILFGTFFNYMKDSEEDASALSVQQKSSEAAESEEKQDNDDVKQAEENNLTGEENIVTKEN